MELSPKELEVLTLVACGYVDKEIARQLNISPKTVDSHLTKILLKLNARTRTHAVAKYMLKHTAEFKKILSKVFT